MPNLLIPRELIRNRPEIAARKQRLNKRQAIDNSIVSLYFSMARANKSVNVKITLYNKMKTSDINKKRNNILFRES
jgi:hypothetical protein